MVRTGRPKKDNAITVPYSVKLSPTLLNDAKEYAKKQNKTVGEVIREAIANLIYGK